MKIKGLYRVVAFVLLFAIQGAILPFYQILHKHHLSVSTGKHGESILKKYEKPCCHSFEVTLEAELPAFVSFTFERPSFALYLDYTNQEFTNLFTSFSNKAPPVKTV